MVYDKSVCQISIKSECYHPSWCKALDTIYLTTALLFVDMSMGHTSCLYKLSTYSKTTASFYLPLCVATSPLLPWTLLEDRDCG